MEYVTMAEGLEFSRVVLGFWTTRSKRNSGKP